MVVDQVVEQVVEQVGKTETRQLVVVELTLVYQNMQPSENSSLCQHVVVERMETDERGCRPVLVYQLADD